MKKKIVFLDAYALNPGDLSWEEFEKLGEFTSYDRTSPDEILERAKDAEIIITNKVHLNESHFKQLPLLKYIGVSATGYDVIDLEAAKKYDILVTNIPKYSTESVAQMVFALLLEATNQVGYFSEENKKGRWSNNVDFCYWDIPLLELSKKTFGIYGFGAIGQAVEKIATAFGMNVCVCSSKKQDELPKTVRKVSLEELFKTSDVISLHCPLTKDTFELINTSSLNLMKRNAILINTARGKVINEQDVANALKEKQIKAYCTDVLSEEPANEKNPLLKAPNCFITPHVAWATREARLRLNTICIDNIKHYLKNTPINVVTK